MSKQLVLTSIDCFDELKRVKWEVEPIGNEEVRCKCPFHKDDRPSLTLNVSKRLFRCFACKESGDVIKLLAKIKDETRGKVINELSSRCELEEAKSIRPDVVEEYHDKIKDAVNLLPALYERGVTDEIIREERLGYDDGRITIPIRDLSGRVVNIRRYLPGAPTDRKFRNTPGFGGLRIYKLERVVKTDRVWICGGELKAAVVDKLLRDRGIGACSSTGGEGSWDKSWNRYFEGKSIWICMDIDTAGREAATRIANLIGAVAKSIRIVRLPLNPVQFPKGDISDYVGKLKAGADELVQLMATAEEFIPVFVKEEEPDKGSKQVTLNTAPRPENVGYRIEFEAITSAADTTPYLIPENIEVTCTRDQPNCVICPIKAVEPNSAGIVEKTISTTSISVLEMINSGKANQNESIREALRIPKCKTVELKVQKHMSALDVRLSPKIDLVSKEGSAKMQPCILINHDPELNEPYKMFGRVHPHPKTQQATLLVDHIEKTEDGLASFQPTLEELNALRMFSPSELTETGIRSKLQEIYEDFEVNVTRIFGRRDLHLGIDLVFHSPLFILDSGRLINGWASALILGDSSQGKSETSTKLLNHYSLGERIDCKNATVAGLLGGLQQLGNRWFVSWGAIPQHDRRLVVLEELKGASTEVFSKLTDMRSSGIAEIPKIERRRTHARTRMLCISNARSSRPIRAYSFGIEAVVELIGSLEDVRRFDLVLIVASGEVSLEKMTAAIGVEHRFTSELTRRLILWAWTRSPQQIILAEGTSEAAEKQTEFLCKSFTETIPLVDRGTTRHKLLRLAAGLAARLFSSPDGEKLEIYPAHVDFVAQFLYKAYSKPVFGYLEFSKAQKDLDNLAEPDKIKSHLLGQTDHPYAVVTGLLYTDDITLQDIQDFYSLDNRDVAQARLSFLVRHRAIRRRGKNGYQKTPQFISLLKDIEQEALLVESRGDNQRLD